MTASEPSSNMLLYASAFQPWRSCLQISAAHLQTVFATAATFRSELVCLAMESMSDDGSMVALQVWFCSSMCWLPSPTSQARYGYEVGHCQNTGRAWCPSMLKFDALQQTSSAACHSPPGQIRLPNCRGLACAAGYYLSIKPELHLIAICPGVYT